MPKQFILIPCFRFFFSLLIAQTAPPVQWKKCFGGSNSELAQAIQQTRDGGYIIAGGTDSNDGDVLGWHGNFDFWVLKIDHNGLIEWQSCIGGLAKEGANSIKQTEDGGYIVGGVVETGVPGFDFFDWMVVKLNAAGTVEWQKKYAGYGDFDHLNSITQTIDGGFIAAGVSNSVEWGVHDASGPEDGLVLKLNDTGAIQWHKSLGGFWQDGIRSIQQTTDSGYILCGYASSTDGDLAGINTNSDNVFQYWIIKLEPDGSIEWQKTFGGSSGSNAAFVRQTNDGGYITAGVTNAVDGDVTGNHGEFDVWVIKLSSLGQVQWQKCFGGSMNDAAYSVEQTNDSGYIIAGYSKSSNGDITNSHGLNDYWIIKLGINGNLEWQKCFGGSADDISTQALQDVDGGYVVAGVSESQNGDVSGNHGGSDIWVVKLGPAVVPLQLSSFVAQKSGNNAQLKWQTQTEVNTKCFVVERSIDAINFKAIGSVNAAGNSAVLQNYTSIDAAPSFGNNYYRIKQVDKDGSFTYSKTVAVTFKERESILYPNPASSVISIAPSEVLRSIIIFDAGGKIAMKLTPSFTGLYNIGNLSKGLYSVKLVFSNRSEVIMLSKN